MLASSNSTEREPKDGLSFWFFLSSLVSSSRPPIRFADVAIAFTPTGQDEPRATDSSFAPTLETDGVDLKFTVQNGRHVKVNGQQLLTKDEVCVTPLFRSKLCSRTLTGYFAPPSAPPPRDHGLAPALLFVPYSTVLIDGQY